MSTNLLVIIDSMCNLDLLFYAAAHSGDSKLAQVAETHARTVLENPSSARRAAVPGTARLAGLSRADVFNMPCGEPRPNHRNTSVAAVGAGIRHGLSMVTRSVVGHPGICSDVHVDKR